MAKSELTIAELEVQAMMLNMWYYRFDHTFNRDAGAGVTFAILDPDTMEEIKITADDQNYPMRLCEVEAGTIGAKDYGPT